MKKLSVVLVFVGLAVLISACGGGKKISLQKTPVATLSPNVVTKPIAKPTIPDGSQALEVTGKTCLPVGSYKVTSKDLGEAFVNSLCSSLAKGSVSGPDDNPRYPQPKMGFDPGGNLSFDAVTADLGESRDSTVSYTISFKNCPSCPRQFSGTAIFEVNQLGDWQLKREFTITETLESGQARVLREVKVKVLSPEIVLGTVGTEPQTNISVEGGSLTLFVLCQFDDGRLTEISRNQDTTQAYAWLVNEPPKVETKVKVVAYSFKKYGFRTDWVYLNK